MTEEKTLTLAERLLAIQSELHIPKAQVNTFGNFKYRSCEDIFEAVKPLLKKYQCLLKLTDDIVMFGERFYVKATAVLTYQNDAILAEAFAREAESKTKMDDSQVTGASSSYARKYALNGMFLIDDTKDADTDENTKKRLEENKPATKISSKSETLNKDAPIVKINAAQISVLLDLANENGYSEKDIMIAAKKMGYDNWEEMNTLAYHTVKKDFLTPKK